MKKEQRKKQFRDIRQRAVNRLRSNAGESMVETLVTMIILSLAVLMLSGAVVTSAKVTKKADNTDTAFVTTDQHQETGIMMITDDSEIATHGVFLNVNVYKTQNNYLYYEPQLQGIN